MSVPFKTILKFATSHHGEERAVLAAAQNKYLVETYANQSADHLLAVMTKCVFSAGFNWKVIDAKWAGFEAAFERFDTGKLAFFGDEMLTDLLDDAGIVRNGQKIRATLENAKFINTFERETGSFAKYLADWPADDQAGLMAWLGKHGARLGGATAQYFLRFSGWDGWITSKDVLTAMVRDGALDKPVATSKSALKQVQSVFNMYHEESGLPRSQISRLLALSVGP